MQRAQTPSGTHWETKILRAHSVGGKQSNVAKIRSEGLNATSKANSSAPPSKVFIPWWLTSSMRCPSWDISRIQQYSRVYDYSNMSTFSWMRKTRWHHSQEAKVKGPPAKHPGGDQDDEKEPAKMMPSPRHHPTSPDGPSEPRCSSATTSTSPFSYRRMQGQPTSTATSRAPGQQLAPPRCSDGRTPQLHGHRWWRMEHHQSPSRGTSRLGRISCPKWWRPIPRFSPMRLVCTSTRKLQSSQLHQIRWQDTPQQWLRVYSQAMKLIIFLFLHTN